MTDTKRLAGGWRTQVRRGFIARQRRGSGNRRGALDGALIGNIDAADETATRQDKRTLRILEWSELSPRLAAARELLLHDADVTITDFALRMLMHYFGKKTTAGALKPLCVLLGAKSKECGRYRCNLRDTNRNGIQNEKPPPVIRRRVRQRRMRRCRPRPHVWPRGLRLHVR
jgi:hypothetical protein